MLTVEWASGNRRRAPVLSEPNQQHQQLNKSTNTSAEYAALAQLRRSRSWPYPTMRCSTSSVSAPRHGRGALHACRRVADMRHGMPRCRRVPTSGCGEVDEEIRCWRRCGSSAMSWLCIDTAAGMLARLQQFDDSSSARLRYVHSRQQRLELVLVRLACGAASRSAGRCRARDAPSVPHSAATRRRRERRSRPSAARRRSGSTPCGAMCAIAVAVARRLRAADGFARGSPRRSTAMLVSCCERSMYWPSPVRGAVQQRGEHGDGAVQARRSDRRTRCRRASAAIARSRSATTSRRAAPAPGRRTRTRSSGPVAP